MAAQPIEAVGKQSIGNQSVSRPPALILARDDAVPPGTLVLGGLQHCAVILGVGIAMPLLVLERGGLDSTTTQQMMSLALIALGIATIFQIQRGGVFGSGYLVPATFTAAYLPPCLYAMERGGPSLVMGMLIFAGLVQMAMAPALRRLRPFLPPEIGGLAVLMIGIILGLLGFRLIMEGAGHPAPTVPDGETPAHLQWLGGLTLATMVALTIWGGPTLKRYATLFGIAGACVVSIAVGAMNGRLLADAVLTGGLALPVPPLIVPHFDPLLALQFAISAVACSLRAMGDIITAQKIEDAHWVRPDMGAIRGGVLADGMGTVVCGALGSPIGVNTFSGSIGLASATGVTARVIGYAIAGWCILFALLPGVITVFIAIPGPVLGGVLIFAAAHIIVNGVMVIVSRLLDARRTLMIGIPLILGISHNVFPEVYSGLPSALAVMVDSDLIMTIGSALVLNLIFRIGVKRTATMSLPARDIRGDRLETWVMEKGSGWGARSDVMRNVIFSLVEFADASQDLMDDDQDIQIALSFDEFHIDLDLTYAGTALTLGQSHPLSRDDMTDIDMDAIEARLRAILIRRLADTVTQHPGADGVHRLSFRFQH